MDYERLSKIAHKNTTALSIFTALARRERDPKKGRLALTALTDSLKKLRLAFNKQEVLSTLVELEKVNMGKIRGDVFHIAEGITLKDICKEVLTLRQTPSVLKTETTPGRHPFLVPLSNRPDRILQISFPEDITQQEAEFAVSFFLRSRGFA